MSAVARAVPAPRRILVAEDEPAANLLLTRLLQRQGFEVLTVMDGAVAMQHLEKETFDAVLLDWMLPSLDGIEIARRIKAAKGPRPRVVMMSVLDIPAARAHASDAGAADFLAKPIDPARLTQALTSLKDPAQAPPADDAGTHPVARTAAWKELGPILTKAVGDMCGEQVVVEESAAIGDDDRVAACAMNEAARGLEFWSTASATPADAKGIAGGILGEPSPSESDADEILAELTNIVAGVLKTKFAPESFAFTLAVPTRPKPVEVRRSIETAAAKKAVGIRVGAFHAVMTFYVRGSGAVELKLDQLREGHVLSEDLRNAMGGLLLPACTRLTETSIKRLRTSLSLTLKVKVCAPGAES